MKFKIIIFYAFTVAATSVMHSQIVNIPDANFKNALVNTLCVPLDETSCEGFFPVDINGNGEIEAAEAEIVDHLCVAIQDIASLEGIEAFINLESLHVENNELTTIDVSQNTFLKELYIAGNMVESIDLSNLPQLEILNVQGNNLTSLDVSNNSNLIRLSCSFNNLSSLDLTQNNVLDDLNASNNELTSIDITQNPNLATFNVGTNQITGAMNLSQNSILRDIGVFRNQITSIDVTNKPALLQLSIGENPLEGGIDVSQSPLLYSVLVNDTQISELNIQNGNNENFTNFRAFNTPNLFCIQVDNPILVQSGAPPYDEWEIDAQAEYRSDCNLGVDEIDTTQIVVYPNPSGDSFYINSETYELPEVTIFNLEGKQLLKLSNIPSQISLAAIPSGILFVKITTDHGVITKKVVKN